MAKKRKIQVKPYIPSGYRFLGLERYNMVLYDNCKQKEFLSYVEANGIKRYITGLDEFAPSVTSIQNDTLRQEKIKEIREAVAELEMKLIYNKIDPNDKDFWSKVKLLHATNSSYWSKIFIELTNNGFELDIKNNPNHKILYYCIKAGGFNTISPSYKSASSNPNKYYFYLDTPEEMDVLDTTEKKLKNKAIAILSSLEENSKHKKLLYLAKILLDNNTEYTLENSIYDLYVLLDEYISKYGNVIDNASLFIKYANLPENELAIYALLNDIKSMKKLYYKDIDGQYYCSYTNSFLGRTMEDCVSYLLMPNNRILMNTIISKYRDDLLQIGIKSEFQNIKDEVETKIKEVANTNEKDNDKKEDKTIDSIEINIDDVDDNDSDSDNDKAKSFFRGKKKM